MQFHSMNSQVKKALSTERREENPPLATILQHYKEIEIQLQDIQSSLQRHHSMHKYNF